MRYKFAFRWCESQGEPWWIKQSNMDMDSRKSDIFLPMSPLILGLGNDFDAERPLGVPASVIHAPTAVVPQSRSAPGKVASLLLGSVR